MMMEQPITSRQKFVSAVLPWVVAIAALGLYLVTLNHGVALNGLPQVARLCRWTWQPELHSPLFWLITYPCRWLPANLVPLALNLFSALCAALTLALLARSVALLPHDRTQEQRDREKSPFGLLSIPKAWQAPVLAALICGLQLTFWESATSLSGSPPMGSSCEMMDLLLFAYVIRCLLEFRIDERQSWLSRAAFVYALGMTNNWAMWGFFPLFLGALLWIKGLSFFNLRFLVRMSLWGLAGLALYLLLPTLQSMADIAKVPFWQGLKANLGSQHYALTFLSRTSRQTILLLSLTSIIPVLIIGIRWSSYFGDNSPMGAGLATFMFHVVHGWFLLACVWVALDPPLSPRYKGEGVPLLTFYYLGALSVGYLAGYFLLLAGVKSRDRSRRTTPTVRFVSSAISAGVLALLFLAPALQIYRNWPQIRVSNGKMLPEYGTLLAQHLPAKGAVVLSDEPRRATILQQALARAGRLQDFVVVDTGSLQWSDYHRFLKQRFPQVWPVEVPPGQEAMFDASFLNRVLYALAQSNSVYYLHPSFGYYFELFYLEPHGLTYKLVSYPTNSLLAPPLPQTTLDENEAFWEQVDRAVLPPVQVAANPPALGRSPGLLQQALLKAHLERTPNRDAVVLAAFYSRARNYWGVEQQKAGRLEGAGRSFERACALMPDNMVAELNLQCNASLQAQKPPSAESRNSDGEFGKYRSWEQAVSENGPFDTPSRCYAQGRTLVQAANYRQAAQQFERTRALAPDHLGARLLLAQIYVVSQQPDAALKIIDEIQSHAAAMGVHRTNQADLLFVEASALLAKNDAEKATKAVQRVLAQYPHDEALLSTATLVYMKYGQFSNALATIEEQLKQAPNDAGILINKGYSCLQLNAYDRAIPPLTRALALETNVTSELHTYAMLNRAVAYLRSGQLDASQRDYEALRRDHTNSCVVYYGLGEIAYRKKDTNAAIRNYQLYLTNAPANPEEVKLVNARLKELQPDSP